MFNDYPVTGSRAKWLEMGDTFTPKEKGKDIV
jgi:hypothetical protein